MIGKKLYSVYGDVEHLQGNWYRTQEKLIYLDRSKDILHEHPEINLNGIESWAIKVINYSDKYTKRQNSSIVTVHGFSESRLHREITKYMKNSNSFKTCVIRGTGEIRPVVKEISVGGGLLYIADYGYLVHNASPIIIDFRGDNFKTYKLNELYGDEIKGIHEKEQFKNIIFMVAQLEETGDIKYYVRHDPSGIGFPVYSGYILDKTPEVTIPKLIGMETKIN